MTEENNINIIESNVETKEPVKKETRGRNKLPDELKSQRNRNQRKRNELNQTRK